MVLQTTSRCSLLYNIRTSVINLLAHCIQKTHLNSNKKPTNANDLVMPLIILSCVRHRLQRFRYLFLFLPQRPWGCLNQTCPITLTSTSSLRPCFRPASPSEFTRLTVFLANAARQHLAWSFAVGPKTLFISAFQSLRLCTFR